MAKLVKVRLFGDLGKHVNPEWNLAVKSVQEAISAINLISNNSFTNYFFKENKLQAKYRVLINGKDFYAPVKEINEKNFEIINQSELVMKKKNLETIDIVPFLESSNKDILGIITVIVGVILIATGFGAGAGIGILSATQVGFIGLTFAMAGTLALLSRPPEFGKFRDIDKAGGESYLFGGPVNIIGEGGPVPIGYGEVINGSQVISSSYKIEDYQIFRTDLN